MNAIQFSIRLQQSVIIRVWLEGKNCTARSHHAGRQQRKVSYVCAYIEKDITRPQQTE